MKASPAGERRRSSTSGPLESPLQYDLRDFANAKADFRDVLMVELRRTLGPVLTWMSRRLAP